MNIISLLMGLLTGKAGEQIGGAVSTVAQWGAAIAALAPVALWLSDNKDGVFITLTYGDLAFWMAILGANVFLVVRLVHRASPPSQ